MKIQVKDTEVNYIRYGDTSKSPIVFLHGWGQNIAMMEPIARPRELKNDVIVIDLPGFGESAEPSFAWEVCDYVECIKEILDKLKIDKPILVGHSFGGKISLLYASKYDVSKLIVLGSPFKKEITAISLKTKILKTAKKIPVLNKLEDFAKKHIGSTDYKNASVNMRKILVNTVNTDITEDVKKITCPTIIIWGTEDDQVSVEDAYELEKMIKDSGVVIYEGLSHYAYLENLGQTISVMNSFLD